MSLFIYSNLTVYLEKCDIAIPSYSGEGRKPVKEKTLSKRVRADMYITGLADKDWQRLEVRNTTKGKLVADYHFRTACYFLLFSFWGLFFLIVINYFVFRMAVEVNL